MTDDEWTVLPDLEDITQLITEHPHYFNYYGGSTLQLKYFSILSYCCTKLLNSDTPTNTITKDMLASGLNRLKSNSQIIVPDLSVYQHMYG
jgi:hypothetical protein